MQEEASDVSADMTRQYKGMQDELLSKIDRCEKRIMEQADKLEAANELLEQERRENAQLLIEKDAELAEQKEKMEEMAVEFSDMLKVCMQRYCTACRSDHVRIYLSCNVHRLDDSRQNE